MKNKRIYVLCLMLAVCAALSGCSQTADTTNAGAAIAESAPETTPVSTAAETEEVKIDLEVKEKLFLAQTNDVYLNSKDYLGKTIKLEGMFFGNLYEPTGEMVYMVIRYGPGCCGSDGQAGFEVRWEDAGIKQPKDNDWVEIIGTLEEYEELGSTYLRLNLSSMKTLFKRGLETVTQ